MNGPLLTFTRARRFYESQCWGLQLPICPDPLMHGFRWLFEMCHRAGEILRTGRSGEDTLVHLGIESKTPSSKETFLFCHFMMTCWQRCTYLYLVIIGHDARRQYALITEYPSSACSSDRPFDPLAPHGVAGESAITNACSPREDTGTQPLTRCRIRRA
jgi:hypothetical protein